MKNHKKIKLKRLLKKISDPDSVEFESKDDYSEMFSKEISKVKKTVEKHEKSQDEIIKAVNILDTKHEAVKADHRFKINEVDDRTSQTLKAFTQFQIHHAKAIEEIKGAVNSLEGNYKGVKSGNTSSQEKIEKLRKEFMDKIDPILTRLEEVGNRRLPTVGGPGPIGVGGSRTMYLNGQNISPFDMYSDYNLIAGSGVLITAVNNNQTWQVDITISATGGGGGGSISVENPSSGAIDGTNTMFTFTHTPQMISWNGQIQNPLASPPDYTISGNTITMATAPQVGDTVVNFYA